MTPTQLTSALSLTRRLARKFARGDDAWADDFHLERDGGLTEEEIDFLRKEGTTVDGAPLIVSGKYSTDWVLMEWVANEREVKP